MCTAVTYKTKDGYFGRNLDLEFSYDEDVVITPRNFEFEFRNMPKMSHHYAMIGMAHVEGEYPLYYDAMNEKGIGMAGLNFVGLAKYNPVTEGKDNLAQFELIPWILGNCASLDEVLDLLARLNVSDVPFNDKFPVAELHWIIVDKNGRAITVEATRSGLQVYQNPVGVLTNNPSFDKQMAQLNNYMMLSPRVPENNFSKNLKLKIYSRGMGAIGLPGDLSSQSRFVRASFVKMNSVSAEDEMSSVNQFFHILDSASQQRGCCDLGNDKYEITIYGDCCNLDKGIFYYKTYDNHQINAVDMNKVDLDGDKITKYGLVDGEQINWQN